MKIRKSTFLLILLVFANNLALAQSDEIHPQLKAWIEVSAAHQAWNIAQTHVNTLVTWRTGVNYLENRCKLLGEPV